MDEVQVFPSEEFGNIRTALIEGKEYFCGNDVAIALCYQVPKNAISRHCKGALFWCPQGETQKMKYIPIGDVYRLIVKASSQSNSEEIKEKAGRFERFVFDEVLPQIHKTGGYGTPQTLQQQIQTIAKGTDELYQRVDNVESRIKDLESAMTIDHGQQYFLGKTVNKTVMSVLGGRESDAYKQIGRKVFAECNGDLKAYFKVNARANVPRKRYEEAVTYAEKWKPCANTQMMIEQCNAQRPIEPEGARQNELQDVFGLRKKDRVCKLQWQVRNLRKTRQVQESNYRPHTAAIRWRNERFQESSNSLPLLQWNEKLSYHGRLPDETSWDSGT